VTAHAKARPLVGSLGALADQINADPSERSERRLNGQRFSPHVPLVPQPAQPSGGRTHCGGLQALVHVAVVPSRVIPSREEYYFFLHK
jgi:hypothetical protein